MPGRLPPRLRARRRAEPGRAALHGRRVGAWLQPGADAWIRRHVQVVAPIERVHERPWATVDRVPVAGGSAWFKVCAPVRAFEPRLSAALHGRWPDRVAEVIAYDEARAWLLLADAGTPLGVYGNPPDAWLRALPPYAELRRGEAGHAAEHLARGVPDLRLATLPSRYPELLGTGLPLEADEVERVRRFEPRFAELCGELAAYGLPDTVQHDDLHHRNVYSDGKGVRVLDWGDASISHPFASLVVTFRFLEEVTRLPAGDPWYDRLRDAYLEPWGSDLEDAFALALRVGAFAHAIAWLRERAVLPPDARRDFDRGFCVILRRALAIGPG